MQKTLKDFNNEIQISALLISALFVSALFEISALFGTLANNSLMCLALITDLSMTPPGDFNILIEKNRSILVVGGQTF